MSETLEPTDSGIGSFRSSVRFDPDRAVVTNVTSHQATTVFVVCLEVGQVLPEHRAPGALTLLVIEGEPTISTANAPRIAAAGDVMMMEVGTAHALAAGNRRAVVVGVLQRSQ